MNGISLLNGVKGHRDQFNHMQLLKDGTSITGTLVDKNKESITVDFEGKNYNFKIDGQIDEKVGDSISFNVQKNNDGWQLSYKGKKQIEAVKSMKGYDAMRQTMGTHEDDDELSIYNYTKKVNEAMDELLKTTSAKDIAYLKTYGIDIRKMSVDMLNGFIQGRKGQEVSQDDLEQYVNQHLESLKDSLEENKESKESFKALEKEGLLPTAAHIKELNGLQKTIKYISQMKESHVIKLMASNQPIQIDSLYKAMHTPDSKTLKSLPFTKDELEAIMSKLGLEPSKVEDIQLVNKFIGQDIALTKENIDVYNQLMALPGLIDENEQLLIHEGAKQIAMGLPAIGLPLVNQYMSSSDKIQDILGKLPEMSEGHIAYLMRKNQPITLGRLSEAVDEIDINNDESSYENKEAATFKRQINEIRLKMTYEVALKLNKQGIEIDTAPLQKVVDALRQEESLIYDKVLKAINGDTGQLPKLAKVMDTALLVKSNSLQAVENLQKLDLSFNLETLGKNVSENAGQAYEQARTEVRGDLGDRFSRIREQIPALLQELDIEASDMNIKAAGALIRNQIEVSQDAIDETVMLMKKLDHATDRLHPLIAAKLLNEGKDPLTMHIDELNAYMDEFADNYGLTTREKVASIMSKLDTKGTFTEEERKGVVAMYRMLHAIDKNEGRAASMLMKEGLEPTLENLLHASRHLPGNRDTQVNLSIDHQTGELQDRIVSDKNIRGALQSSRMDIESNKERVLNLQQEDLEISKENLIKHYHQEEAIKEQVRDMVQNHGQQQNAVKVFESIDGENMSTLVANNIEPTIKNLKSLKGVVPEEVDISDSLDQLDSALHQAIYEEVSGNRTALLQGKSPDAMLDDLKNLSEELQEQVIIQGTGQGSHILQQLDQIGHTISLQQQLHSNKEGLYQLPITVGNEITQLNIFLVNDIHPQSKEGITGAISLKTTHLGKVKGSMHIQDRDVSIQLEVQEQVGAETLASYNQEIKDLLSDLGYTLNEFTVKGREIPIRSSMHPTMLEHNSYQV